MATDHLKSYFIKTAALWLAQETPNGHRPLEVVLYQDGGTLTDKGKAQWPSTT